MMGRLYSFSNNIKFRNLPKDRINKDVIKRKNAQLYKTIAGTGW